MLRYFWHYLLSGFIGKESTSSRVLKLLHCNTKIFTFHNYFCVWVLLVFRQNIRPHCILLFRLIFTNLDIIYFGHPKPLQVPLRAGLLEKGSQPFSVNVQNTLPFLGFLASMLQWQITKLHPSPVDLKKKCQKVVFLAVQDSSIGDLASH